MEIMRFRESMIDCAFQGYDTHGFHFIDGCSSTLSALGGDDMGIVYFSTLIHSWLDTGVTESAQIFLFGCLIAALLIGWLGALIAFRELKQRIFISVGFILLSSVALISHAGVYAVSSAAAIMTIPWFLVIFRPQSNVSPWKYLFIFFLVGVVFAVSDFVRAYAGAPVLVFALTILLFKKHAGNYLRGIAVLAFILGAIGPIMYFGSLLDSRDGYITSQNASYKPPLKRHLFWHTAYIGLGYTANDFGVIWSDKHAFEALEARAPGTSQLSEESEQIHKQLFMEIISQHPVFMIMNISAKAGVLAVMVLIFANAGLLIRGDQGLDPPFRFAFLTSMIMASSYGLLAIPSINYTTQLIAIAAMYGIFSIAAAMPHGIRSSLLLPKFSR